EVVAPALSARHDGQAMRLQVVEAAGAVPPARDRELEEPQAPKPLEGPVQVVGGERVLVLPERLGDLVHLRRLVERAAQEEDATTRHRSQTAYTLTPMSAPRRAPASTSLRKCRPSTTREAATLAARASTGPARTGKLRARTVPIAKAFSEWPEGNE